MSDQSEDIVFERRGVLGLVTLNRPKAMNALTHAMALALHAQLDAWAGDDSIAVVAIQGAGEKAFCAGGDIRALYDAGAPGGERGRANWAFYADEYRLNARIKGFPKPYIAVMDGITMGGGVGVAIHGTVRISTERTVFAMPETGIGLFPDVGGTWFLPRLPRDTGLWLGLTGTRLRGDDVGAAKLSDMVLPSAAIGAVLAGLAEGDGALLGAAERARRDADPTHALTLFAGRATALAPLDPSAWDDHHAGLQQQGSKLVEEIALRHEVFAGETLEAVMAALDAAPTDWAKATAAAIRSKSPACTRMAFRQIREGARLDFRDCMRLEYRLARFCMTQPDFYEGVRALIIDKDNTPRWSPATLEEADDAFVAPAFAPLGAEELDL